MKRKQNTEAAQWKKRIQSASAESFFFAVQETTKCGEKAVEDGYYPGDSYDYVKYTKETNMTGYFRELKNANAEAKKIFERNQDLISKTCQRRFGAEMTRATHEKRFRAKIMRFGLGRNAILALRLNV